MSHRTLTLALACVLIVLTAPSAATAARGNPFRGARLYVDRSSAAAKQERAWSRTRPADAAQIAKIARTPSAEWLGGWVPHVGSHLRSQIFRRLRPAHATGFFALYNIPGRDCGSYSSGGLRSPAAYRRWIEEIRRAIGSYPAVFVAEPDALMTVNCLSASKMRDRLALLRYAVRRLSSLRRTSVYIDAGNSGWPQVGTMSRRLREAGVRYARGFALNATGYEYTSSEVRYGRRLAGALGGKHFIVNSSRNGRGPLPRSQAHTSQDLWCNPWGRALGTPPTTATSHPLVDAYAWFANPGYSDGPCNGGPPSGQWWPDLALSMAQRAY